VVSSSCTAVVGRDLQLLPGMNEVGIVDLVAVRLEDAFPLAGVAVLAPRDRGERISRFDGVAACRFCSRLRRRVRLRRCATLHLREVRLGLLFPVKDSHACPPLLETGMRLHGTVPEGIMHAGPEWP